MENRKTLKEMSLDELNEVSGGRLVRESEWTEYSELLNKLTRKCRELRIKNEDTQELRDRFDAAFEKWYADIKNSPENSADIKFSNYTNDILL